ncbi:MAG: 3'(2'),5'-bisphosphate nucleotidase [Gammaproteobacteria bacterium]|nr:3'(2'),5'-bisphosphate nucleotidase [Gammaproteobacteria bacterium]|tara:strand:- start:1505 stop:2317 length:813 start_codon:yes stop_codon:yes gene_type:complete
MDKNQIVELSEKALTVANKASEKIMDVYLSEDFIQKAKGDGSPVTKADLLSHEIICKELSELKLDIPILSEEDKDLSTAKEIRTFWLIDPLDGTKEFINRNDEFTVNIALVEKGIPVLGIVSLPATKEVYIGAKGVGAFKEIKGIRTGIRTKTVNPRKAIVAISRSHQSKEDLDFLSIVERRFNEVEVIEAGSSLKMCLVAEGLADIYCRRGPTYQWDIASGHAVLVASGGALNKVQGEEIKYEFDSSKKNPEFYCVGDTSFNWDKLFQE